MRVGLVDEIPKQNKKRKQWTLGIVQLLLAAYTLTSRQTSVLLKTCWKRLEDVFIVTFFVLQEVFKPCLQDVFYILQARLEDALKTSCKDVLKMSSRRLQDFLEDEKLLRWRRLGKQNVCWNFLNLGITYRSIIHGSLWRLARHAELNLFAKILLCIWLLKSF